MKTAAVLASLPAAMLRAQPVPPETFICVEWPGHPHGYDAPVYYWNSAHEAYIWHGADCRMFSTGEALNCDASRIMGTEGNDAQAYSEIQDSSTLDDRKRLAFFKSCRLTINMLGKDDEGAWVFKQNGATEASGGTCSETNVEKCNGKFSEAMKITAGAEACLSSERGGRNYRGYFASIAEKLVDGVNPVLNMPARFKAMVDGGIQCNSTDNLPAFAVDEAAIYGVMSWDNSEAIQLIEQVVPKPECLVAFSPSEADTLEVGGNTNHTCMQNFTGVAANISRRLNGVAGGMSAMALLAQSTDNNLQVSASWHVGLAAWALAALTLRLI